MDVYAYPNPFNPDMGSSHVRYSLSEDTNVTIEIYDASGELVTTLIEEQPKEKTVEYSEAWDGTNDRNVPVAAGIYFCRMEAGDPSTSSPNKSGQAGQRFVKVIKLALVK